jgi:hypothetical protein
MQLYFTHYNTTDSGGRPIHSGFFAPLDISQMLSSLNLVVLCGEVVTR